MKKTVALLTIMLSIFSISAIKADEISDKISSTEEKNSQESLSSQMSNDCTTVNAQKSVKDVRDSGAYFSIGVGPLPVLLPTFSLHYKLQRNHFGMDNSLLGATIISQTAVKFSSLYYYYPRPNLQRQWYYGGGLGLTSIFENSIKDPILSISPEIVLGKQYITKSQEKRFIQTQISFPNFTFKKKSHYPFTETRHSKNIFFFPIVTISYGMSF